jgi:hypothetical protein
LRKTLALILAFIIILASFGVVIAAKYLQINLQDQMGPSVDCSYLKSTDAELYSEYIDSTLTTNQKVKTFCYCAAKLLDIGPMKALDLEISYNGNNFLPCHGNISTYLQAESLKYLVIILIPVINLVLSLFLECI